MMKMVVFKGIRFSKYLVDTEGNVFRKSSMRKLIPFDDGRGYFRVDIMTDDNQVIRAKIHMISAHTYLGPQKDGYIINHIDANKHNNSVNNLEYITQRENVAHAMKYVKNKVYLSDDTIRDIKIALKNGEKEFVIASRLNIPSYVIRDINKGITYRHVIV